MCVHGRLTGGNVNPAGIEKYSVRWKLDAENEKAYPGDKFVNEDCQLLNFMKKMGRHSRLTMMESRKEHVFKLFSLRLY